jgi:hypothetical protein
MVLDQGRIATLNFLAASIATMLRLRPDRRIDQLPHIIALAAEHLEIID